MRNLLPLSALMLLSCSESSPSSALPPPGAAVEKSKVISRGQAYSPKDYLVPGHVTILDFYADW